MSREAIIDVVNLYSVALDSHSWDLFDLVFAADVEADYPAHLHWFDLASFKQGFAEMHEPLVAHQHLLGNPVVHIDGERAWALTYGSFRLFRSPRAEQFGDMNEGGCWYDDTLRLTPAGWRIAKRTARNFWWRGMMEEDGMVPVAVDSFPQEAKAGRVAYVQAVRASLGR